jgi:phosphoribosyl 1,2-cyclic phosphodiesterase
MSATIFCPLISGSSGNCIYIGDKTAHVLFDAGASGKTIETLLSSYTDAADIAAVFISHEHIDHIRGAGVLSRRYDIPIYANHDTWAAMDGNLGKLEKKNIRLFSHNEIIRIGGLKIKPFSTKHDAVSPSGFNVFVKNKKISIATDLGVATDAVLENIADSHILFLESNHDIEMLKNGPYPIQLKRRIMSDFGHLSNAAAGDALSKIYSKKLEHVYLGHLSAENNEPLIALETVTNILCMKNITPGKDLSLYVANRDKKSNPTLI